MKAGLWLKTWLKNAANRNCCTVITSKLSTLSVWYQTDQFVRAFSLKTATCCFKKKILTEVDSKPKYLS